MARKNQSYTEYLYAWDIATNLPKTGDAANITVYTAKDGGSSGVSTNSVAEVDATNMPGIYSLLLTAAEMNGNSIAVAGTSVTAQVQVNPAFISTEDIKTDTLQLITDVGSVQTDTTQIISDVAAVKADTTQLLIDTTAIEADTTQLITDVGNVQTDTTQILADLAVVDTVVDLIKIDTSAIVAKLPAGTISDLDLDDVVDGAKLRTIFGLMKARVLNRYLVNNPNTGDITFYQNDGVTFFARVNVTDVGRTLTSFVDL